MLPWASHIPSNFLASLYPENCQPDWKCDGSKFWWRRTRSKGSTLLCSAAANIKEAWKTIFNSCRLAKRGTLTCCWCSLHACAYSEQLQIGISKLVSGKIHCMKDFSCFDSTVDLTVCIAGSWNGSTEFWIETGGTVCAMNRMIQKLVSKPNLGT